MDKKQNIGRNDPCPCGSGKKYKKCCGAVADVINIDKALDSIRFNAKIGYVGTLGRRREAFCSQYIEHKRKLIELISNKQIQEMKSIGKAVSCRKGCSFCCDEIFPVSLQEGEAIAYYLYRHEKALHAFVQAFPRWLAEARKHEDIFIRREQIETKGFSGQISFEEMQKALGKEAESYWKLHIPCPFLNGGECLIYEVRPWTCVNLFSTTPLEWCSPSSVEKPNLHLTSLTELPLPIDLPFWDDRIEVIYHGNVSDMVYKILTGGMKFLSEIPGLGKVWEEFLSDPEVRQLVKQLNTGSTM